jgi:hypothetical protein
MLLDETLFKLKLSSLDNDLMRDIQIVHNNCAAKGMAHSGYHLELICDLLLSYIDTIIEQIKNNCLTKFIHENPNKVPSYQEIKEEFDETINPKLVEFENILKKEISKLGTTQDHKENIITELGFTKKARTKLEIFYKELECDLKEQ